MTSNNNDTFPKGKPRVPWNSSKEEQWEILSKKLGQQPRGKQVFLPGMVWRYTVAAMIVLFVMGGIFARFYSVTITTGNAERASVDLPDGSTVTLNAGSEINYHKYWWWMERNISLSGEAYFEVENGNSFSVSSPQGTTEVLGTKFNVYARENAYRVVCFEGSVEVSLSEGNSITLQPNELAVKEGDQLHIQTTEKPDVEAGWRNNYYIFTAADIAGVIAELERQYNVSIDYQGDPAVYTGSFRQEMGIEQVLNVISRTLDLEWNKKSDSSYVLKKK